MRVSMSDVSRSITFEHILQENVCNKAKNVKSHVFLDFEKRNSNNM